MQMIDNLWWKSQPDLQVRIRSSRTWPEADDHAVAFCAMENPLSTLGKGNLATLRLNRKV